jgi:catechol 2,3-dioxygenase-like lactoylglutathione lyase family enzyme
MESAMVEARKARAVGFNHVALEVGDIEEALAFYRRLFDFELRGKSATSAFIDLGDQFLALQKEQFQAKHASQLVGQEKVPKGQPQPKIDPEFVEITICKEPSGFPSTCNPSSRISV